MSPQWIATLSSCFAVDGQPVATGAPALATTVTVGRANLAGSGGRVLPVTRIVPHPTRDVLLARLAMRVTDVAPIRVSGAAPAAGEELRTAGHGRTATEWVPDRLQAAPALVGAVAAGSFSWTGPGGAETTLCQGDAGGPVIRAGGSQPELVGLNGTAGQGGCLDAPEDNPHGATAVRVDDLASWIAQNAVEPTTTFRAYHNSPSGIGGFDLGTAADQIVPFDYEHSGKLDHLVVYRPGSGKVRILKHGGDDTYTQVFDSTTGIGGYDLKSAADQIVAFDYDHSGKLDHLLLYRPGGKTAFVLRHGSGNTFTPVYSSTTEGIGGYDLKNTADRVVAYDYEHTGKLDHLLLYRPGAKTAFVLRHGSGNSFTPVYSSTTAGIGGYDLNSAADRVVAFDYEHTGKLDHLLFYRPGQGTFRIVKRGSDGTFSSVFHGGTGIGGYDLADTRDQILAYDYERTGKLDHLLLYRPGTGTLQILRHGSGTTFSAVFVSGTGIGGYTLESGRDRIVAFDDDHAGTPAFLVVYRPVDGIVWVLGRHEPAGSAPVTVRPTVGADSTVERFAYPGAAEILETLNVRLISGDGHILLADCATPPVDNIGVIKVYTTEPVGPEGDDLVVCFKVTGATGRLDLEVPGVFEIRGDGQRPGFGHPLTAVVTTEDGPPTTVVTNPSGSTPVGIGIDPNNDPTTLLQLRVPS